MKLYEISTEYQKLVNEIDDSEEILPGQLEKLTEISDSFEEKCKNYAFIIKNLEAEHDVINDTIQKMIKRCCNISSRVEYIKINLKSEMENCKVKKIKTPYFNISIIPNNNMLDIYDNNIIPEEYIKEDVKYRVMRSKIIKDLREGKEVPGAILINKSKLRIG